MKAKILVIAAVAIGGAVLFVAWFSEPSAANIKDAINKNERFNMMLTMFIPPGQNKAGIVADMKKNAVVDKSGCTSAQGAPGHVCDFRYGRRLPTGEISYSPPVKARFFQSGGSWVAELD